jgi:hypothetical protein
MLRRMLAVAFLGLLNLQFWAWGQETSTAGRKAVAPFRPILEVLDAAKSSGSLELSVHCDGGSPLPLYLPILHAPAMSGGSPLQALREILADNPAMQITQGSDGTFRMIETGTPTDLLNVRISHISFESDGVPAQASAFSANTALLHAILRAPEIVDFMKAHDIVFPFGEGGSLHNTLMPTVSPHIVGSMDNLTFSQALDRVLKTFPGMWVYERCGKSNEKSSFVFVWFFSLRERGLLVEQ